MVKQQLAKKQFAGQKSSKERKTINPKNYMNFVMFLVLFTVHTSQAKNLGVWGATFPIVEKDIKEFIYERLNQMQKNGEMAKLKSKFIRNVKEHSLRPPPVQDLTTTDKPKIFYHDPTYVLDKDIKDDKERVIAKAGTKINPLDTVQLHSVLFFLNTDDKRQVKWALENVKRHDYVKYILVQGNIKDAGEILSDRIYFDQYGLLTRKFGIRHVPCIVKQVGKKLQIEEFSLKAEVDKSKNSRDKSKEKKN